MAADRNDLLPGTLELLVLKALSLEPMHGWGIGQRIDQLSKDVFRVAQGSLYPGLQRMLRKGWIRAEWRTSDNNRRARYYSLTRAGRRQLETEASDWRRASETINAILRVRLAEGDAWTRSRTSSNAARRSSSAIAWSANWERRCARRARSMRRAA